MNHFLVAIAYFMPTIRGDMCYLESIQIGLMQTVYILRILHIVGITYVKYIAYIAYIVHIVYGTCIA